MYSQEILANYLSSLQLDQIHAEGNVLRDKDIERLSPLLHEHINLHGRYYCGLTDRVWCRGRREQQGRKGKTQYENGSCSFAKMGTHSPR